MSHEKCPLLEVFLRCKICDEEMKSGSRDEFDHMSQCQPDISDLNAERKYEEAEALLRKRINFAAAYKKYEAARSPDPIVDFDTLVKSRVHFASISKDFPNGLEVGAKVRRILLPLGDGPYDENRKAAACFHRKPLSSNTPSKKQSNKKTVASQRTLAAK